LEELDMLFGLVLQRRLLPFLLTLRFVYEVLRAGFVRWKGWRAAWWVRDRVRDSCFMA